MKTDDVGLQAKFLWPPAGACISLRDDTEVNYGPIVVRVTQGQANGPDVPVSSGSYLLGGNFYIAGEIVEDGNGIVYFQPVLGKAYRDIDVVYTVVLRQGMVPPPVIGSTHWAVRVDDQNADSLRSVIVWPSPDVVLPVDTDIIVHAFQIEPDGLLPSAWWPPSSQLLPPLIWTSSPAGIVEALADLPRDPNNNTPQYVRRAKLRIPSTSAPSTVSITVQSAPGSPVQVIPATQTWRVATPSTVNRLYLAPPLDGAGLPVDWPMPAVATYLDQDGNPIQGATIEWSWQSLWNNPAPPVPTVINAQTDKDGKSYATIMCPSSSKATRYTQTLQARVARTSNAAQAGNLLFNARFGGPGAIQTIEPKAADMPLTSGQPHTVEIAYSAPGGTSRGRTVTWSTFPYQPDVSFDPPTATVDNNFGLVSTKVVAKARSTLSDVSIVATAPTPYNTGGMDKAVPLNVSFVPATDSELLISPPADNAPLPVNFPVSAVATYVDANGNGIPNAPVQWGWANSTVADQPQPPLVFDSATNSNGQCHAAIYATVSQAEPFSVTADLYAIVTDPVSGHGYQAWARNLDFSTANGGPGKIVVQSSNGTTFTSGQPYPLSATYTLVDGTRASGKDLTLTWTTSPRENVTFAPNPSPVVDGQSSTTVTAAAGLEVSNISIVATSPNPYAASARDTGTLSGVTFEAKPTLPDKQSDRLGTRAGLSHDGSQ